MANKSKARTVAKVYLIVCYGLAVATLVTFGGAEGNPQLPGLAYCTATLPLSAALIFLVKDGKGNWIIVVTFVLLPAANLLLGWLIWSVIRKLFKSGFLRGGE